jgi:hypothetical protein
MNGCSLLESLLHHRANEARPASGREVLLPTTAADELPPHRVGLYHFRQYDNNSADRRKQPRPRGPR